jgi:BirA family biotin operon repressor/biotin-[acetyl-CoA-carboxylase] ligase
MTLDIARLERELQDEDFFTQWVYRAEVGSTMDVARELADRRAPEGTIVIAERQTAGRGRRGREWVSLPGGLWVSLLLRPQIELCQAGCISILTAVAIADALQDHYGIGVRVKWPNDLMLQGKKLGGVLVELATVAQRIDWLITGLGINGNNSIPEGARIPAISLSNALEHPVELEACLMVILREIARFYRVFLREGFEPIRQRWEELSALEDGIWVQKGEERFEAQVKGLSTLGKLIVERSGRIEELMAEEVTLSLKE